MKGISLSIETVVLVILASIVLAVLLAFLWNAIITSDDYIKKLQKQNAACSEIFQVDSACNPNNQQITSIVEKKLIAPKVCYTDRSECTTAGPKSAAINCINSCCEIFCPVVG